MTFIGVVHPHRYVIERNDGNEVNDEPPSDIVLGDILVVPFEVVVLVDVAGQEVDDDIDD